MSPPCRPSPLTAPAIVARAERFSRERRVPFTPMRRRVLEALTAAHASLTAYALADRVSDTKRVSPVQVYRALDFLIAAGVIHRLATKSAYIACEHDHEPGETTVFLLCDTCGSVAEKHSRAVERGLRGMVMESGFEPRRPVVEIEGRCAACQGTS